MDVLSSDDPALDDLFAAPLKDFVAKRKAIAKDLKAKGERERAASVDAIGKPTSSAWALNQMVRLHPTEVNAVLDALDAVREAQLGAATASGPDGEALRAATRVEREAFAQAANLARGLLTEAGQSASRDHVDRTMRALRGAAMKAEGRAVLLAGRLVTDYEDGGFEALTAMADFSAMRAATPRAAAPRPVPTPADTHATHKTRAPAPARSTVEAGIDEVARARARADERRRQKEEETRRREAEEAIATARATLKERRAERDAAEAALKALKDTESQAARALEAAQAASTRAAKVLSRATEAVDGARGELDELLRRIVE